MSIVTSLLPAHTCTHITTEQRGYKPQAMAERAEEIHSILRDNEKKTKLLWMGQAKVELPHNKATTGLPTLAREDSHTC